MRHRRIGKLRVSKVGPAEVHPTMMNFRYVGRTALSVKPQQDNVVHERATKVCSSEVCESEVRPGEVYFLHLGPGEVYAFEVCSGEKGSPKIRFTEISHLPRNMEAQGPVWAPELEHPEICTTEVRNDLRVVLPPLIPGPDALF